MRVRILGKHYDLVDVPAAVIGEDDGECDPPWVKGKQIRIAIELDDAARLDTMIHEATHAAFWWLDELWGHAFGRDVARILWRDGYRRKKPGSS